MGRRDSRSPERYPEWPALRASLRPFGDARPARVRWRDRLLALLFTVSAHLIVFAGLFRLHAAPPSSNISPPLSYMLVSMVDLPEPEPPGSTNAPEVEARDHDRDDTVPPTPQHLAAPTSSVPPAISTPALDYSDLLSEAELAGAASAGEEGLGGRGSGCDTAGVVQQALRRDPLVREAVEEANRLGKAIMLWNGDWVRSGGQDGKGLAAVREAVMWEVGFAPEACRNQRMHGLVLLSLSDGDTRFAIGSDDWRWSDLLGVHGVAPDR
jgi:hypothetical protein